MTDLVGYRSRRARLGRAGRETDVELDFELAKRVPRKGRLLGRQLKYRGRGSAQAHCITCISIFYGQANEKAYQGWRH